MKWWFFLFIVAPWQHLAISSSDIFQLFNDIQNARSLMQINNNYHRIHVVWDGVKYSGLTPMNIPQNNAWNMLCDRKHCYLNNGFDHMTIPAKGYQPEKKYLRLFY